jgi:hypothetical protein
LQKRGMAVGYDGWTNLAKKKPTARGLFEMFQDRSGFRDASQGLHNPFYCAPNTALGRWFQQKILHIFL